MRCPTDRSDLTVVERHGVDVHLCTVCQGIWLAEGDLEVIIGHAIAAQGDDLDPEADDHRKPRRRDKYSDGFAFDGDDRPRKGRSHRRGSRETVDDYADY
jgi:Zn-finger nucleic acid-binding protein